jgi:hypothetical protein
MFSIIGMILLTQVTGGTFTADMSQVFIFGCIGGLIMIIGSGMISRQTETNLGVQSSILVATVSGVVTLGCGIFFVSSFSSVGGMQSGLVVPIMFVSLAMLACDVTWVAIVVMRTIGQGGWSKEPIDPSDNRTRN